MRVEAAREVQRRKNNAWADRAEAARMWREHLKQERYEKCNNTVDMKDRKLEQFNSWRDRTLVEVPRRELERRTTWLAGAQSCSNLEVDRHHRKVLDGNSSMSRLH